MRVSYGNPDSSTQPDLGGLMHHHGAKWMSELETVEIVYTVLTDTLLHPSLLPRRYSFNMLFYSLLVTRVNNFDYAISYSGKYQIGC